MSPDQKTNNGDAETGRSHEMISEEAFASEGRHDFRHHSHSRKDHDVNGRMGIEPEQVLEQDRIAAPRRVEESDMKDSFHGHQGNGNGDYRSSQDENDRGGVVGPHEEGQPEPGHSRRPHGVNGHNEIQARQNGGEAGNEDSQRGGDDAAVGINAA